MVEDQSGKDKIFAIIDKMPISAFSAFVKEFEQRYGFALTTTTAQAAPEVKKPPVERKGVKLAVTNYSNRLSAIKVFRELFGFSYIEASGILERLPYTLSIVGEEELDHFTAAFTEAGVGYHVE